MSKVLMFSWIYEFNSNSQLILSLSSLPPPSSSTKISHKPTPSSEKSSSLPSKNSQTRYISKGPSNSKGSDPTQGSRKKNESSLKFPTASSPTPFQIFHLSENASTSEIKSRYYQLVKIYHPDLANINSRGEISSGLNNDDLNKQEVEKRFKLIVDAYELLKSPSRRECYKRFGTGWIHDDLNRRHSLNRYSGLNRGRSSYSYRTNNGDEVHVNYNYWSEFLRGKSPLRGREGYDESDWSRFRDRDSRPSSSFKEQWQRQGLFTRNGFFISSVGCLGLMVYLIQFWGVWIPISKEQRKNRNQLSSTYENDLIEFEKYLEPKGDQRLDREAWKPIELIRYSTLKSSPTTTALSSGPDDGNPETETRRIRVSDLSSPNKNSNGDGSNVQNQSKFSSYIERLDQQNQRCINDLKSARQSALPPSQFVDRFSSSSSNNNHNNQNDQKDR